MTSEDANDVLELQTGNNGRNLNIYTADLIMSATNGFSPDNLLGKGGFGPVFKVFANPPMSELVIMVSSVCL